MTRFSGGPRSPEWKTRYWTPERRERYSLMKTNWWRERHGDDVVAPKPVYRNLADPRKGLGYLDDSPARSFEECWHRARRYSTNKHAPRCTCGRAWCKKFSA